VFEIGNSLREARLRRSIEFVQAEQATKIRVKYLRALEDERFEQLPSQTYVKGFLRTYAEYLGLDGQLYVDEFNSRFVVGDDHDSRPRRSSVRPERRNRRVETNVVLLALTAIAVITVVVISAWQFSGSGSSPPAAPPAQPAAKKSKAAVPPAALEITAVKGPSYVEVHRNGPAGALLFQGTIEKGRSEPFRTGTAFWVSIASPENLLVKNHGRTVRLTGYRPETLTITRGGVRPD
jgi:cytoskeletal protein RodZ